MDEKKRQLWRFVIQTAISILTAIATALGVTSCMAGVYPGRAHAPLGAPEEVKTIKWDDNKKVWSVTKMRRGRTFL